MFHLTVEASDDVTRQLCLKQASAGKPSPVRIDLTDKEAGANSSVSHVAVEHF